MARLRPIHWRKAIKLFEKLGYEMRRQKGSHIAMIKPGKNRPIIIPTYDEIGLDIIHGWLKTEGIDRDTFMRLVDEI